MDRQADRQTNRVSLIFLVDKFDLDLQFKSNSYQLRRMKLSKMRKMERVKVRNKANIDK